MKKRTHTGTTWLVGCALAVIGIGGCSSGGGTSAQQQQPTATGPNIEAQIKKALPTSNIRAQVSGNTVTLTGTISQPHEAGIAQSIAKNTAPNHTITSQLGR